jgi:hypothetical protein
LIFDFGRVGAAKLQPYIYRMKKIKYILNDLWFLKVLNSPFKPFKVKLYAGKTRIGVPYFFPRKWIKATPELARKATLEYIKSEERYNELNPKYARKIKPYEEIYKEKLRYNYVVPLKVGFSYCGLGYKTKWSSTDYRYEYGPVFSFVFFGYQIALMIGDENPDSYWESWLYYEYNTNKSKSKAERIKQCREEFPQTWIRYLGGKKERIDYYNLILKEKYLK